MVTCCQRTFVGKIYSFICFEVKICCIHRTLHVVVNQKICKLAAGDSVSESPLLESAGYFKIAIITIY